MSGRDLPPPSPFAGDDGSQDPALAAAGTDPAAVVAALAHARLLVPVVSQLEEKTGDGPKKAHAAMVTVGTPDGRAAVPVFSSMEALHRWRSDARPIPVEGPRAAAAAIQESDSLLVLDPGSDTELLVPRPAVVAIATGGSWEPAFENQQVSGAVAKALEPIPAVKGHRLSAGNKAELRIEITLPAGLDRAALITASEHISAALAASEVVATQVDSVELSLRQAQDEATGSQN